ncbi:MAG: hypothetical protein OEO79_09575 [Gemmatimonadota bacterium]|nr:hypothetical protein [Gemmatimonadota bacterium]MDH3422024.1 hypothetical protein [Gemmatimonadota bacterium]
MSDVVVLQPAAVPEVVDVLHESFFDYPVMRFVLGTGARDYERRLRTLVFFFVMARVFRDEVLLGIRTGEHLVGAALVSRPGGAEPAPDFVALRAETWSELGKGAQARYRAFGDACAPFDIGRPHLHLNMIGVRDRALGTGLGRKLIDSVHERSRVDAESVGVTLTTEAPGNVALYQHFAYEIVGRATVAPGLMTWGFFRPD